MNRNDTAHAPRRGFSLVELMMVVTIIGSLATIAMPSFMMMKAKVLRVERTLVEANILASAKDWVATHPGGGFTFLSKNPPFPADGSQQLFDPSAWTIGALNWRTLVHEFAGLSRFRYQFWAQAAPAGNTIFIMSEGDADLNGAVSVHQLWYTAVGDEWVLQNETTVGDLY
jgi:prepilin-type N-terminal cleavage/methylation domain-containing protein